LSACRIKSRWDSVWEKKDYINKRKPGSAKFARGAGALRLPPLFIFALKLGGIKRMVPKGVRYAYF
jgi:hypothetical protein